MARLDSPGRPGESSRSRCGCAKPGGPRYDVEYRVVRPDGTLRVVHSQGDVTWDDSGQPLRQFGVLHDITELNRRSGSCARARRASAPWWTTHPMRSFSTMRMRRFSMSNRQACESLGYRRDELIGRTAFDYGPDLTPELLLRIRERLRAGKTVTYDGRHRRKDGTVFPVEVRIRPFWHEGQLLAVSLDRDITARKRAEDELRASEERFRTLVQFSFDVYWESDAQHRFIRQEFAEGLADAPAPGSEIGKTRWEVPYFRA